MPNRRQTIIWTNAGPIHWRIYVALGGDESLPKNMAWISIVTFTVFCEMSLPIYAMATHYSDVIMGAMESQITSLTIVCLTVDSGADQRKHQSSASLAFVWGIHRWPVNSPHKWPVTRKMSPFDDVIMIFEFRACMSHYIPTFYVAVITHCQSR